MGWKVRLSHRLLPEWLFQTMDLRVNCYSHHHRELGERENVIACPTPANIHTCTSVVQSVTARPCTTESQTPRDQLLLNNNGTTPPHIWLSVLPMSPLVNTSHPLFFNKARPSVWRGVGWAKEQYVLRSVYDAKAANLLIGPRWCWPPTQVWTKLRAFNPYYGTVKKVSKNDPIRKDRILWSVTNKW